jgi:ABC-type transport system substrate-binding protein
VFERFASLDDKGELAPLFATRIQRADPGTTRLEFRSGGRFSDGTPIEKEDVVRSLEAAGMNVMAQGSTLTVASQQRGLPTEQLLLRAWIFRESAGRLLGSGPYTVASQTASELRLVRRVPRPDRINEVRMISYPSPRDAYMHTLKGDANLLYNVEPRWIELFEGVPTLQVLRIAPKNSDSLIFNGRLPTAERRALAAVLDSEPLRQLAYGPSECAESRGIAKPGASVPPGPPLRILSWGSHERLGLAARRALGDRGEVSFLDAKDALPRLARGEFDLVTAHPQRWPPSVLAMAWRTGSPFNTMGYSNPLLDRAADEGDWTAAEQALRDDPPLVHVCTRDVFAVIDPRLRNVSFGPTETMETLPDWEVTP